MPPELPDIEIEDINQFLEALKGVKAVGVGVAVVGDAADYALVWEWGNTRQKKAGPRTVKGSNPNKKMVWLSSQAPFGYIRINEPFMHRIVDEVISDLDFDQPTASALSKVIEAGAKKISKAIAEIISNDAPLGSADFGDPHPGLLKRSIVPVDPNDRSLSQETDEFDTLDLE